MNAPAPGAQDATLASAGAGWLRRWHRAGHGHRSLGLRLVALFLLLALASTAIVLGGMERTIAYGYANVVRPLLADYVDHLVADIGSPPQAALAQALEQRLPIRIHIEGPLLRYGQAARWQRRGDAAAADGAMPTAAQAEWHQTRRTADGHRITFSLAPGLWRDGPRAIGWAMLALLLLATALAYHAVRHLFRPIQAIGQGARRYGQGDFSQPIAVRRQDELGDLAGQVNTMASELQRMLEAKRELLLSISHELRSPLTRARLNAELLGDAVPANPAQAALLRDLAEMKRLIEQLLEHERLASGHRALHRQPCDVAVLVQDVLSTHFEGQPLTLNISSDVGQAALDIARVELALRNLVANALQHGAAAGLPQAQQQSQPQPRSLMQVQVDVSREADLITLCIRDQGPGVPPGALPRLAEPFFRPDAARGRSAGGVGLGLALCRMVAQAHGGTVVLRNAQPGLEVRMTLSAQAGAGAD